MAGPKGATSQSGTAIVGANNSQVGITGHSRPQPPTAAHRRDGSQERRRRRLNQCARGFLCTPAAGRYDTSEVGRWWDAWMSSSPAGRRPSRQGASVCPCWSRSWLLSSPIKGTRKLPQPDSRSAVYETLHRPIATVDSSSSAQLPADTTNEEGLSVATRRYTHWPAPTLTRPR